MMRTITGKLTRIYLIVAISILFSTGLISMLYLYHYARTIAHENLRTQAVALAGNLEAAVTFGDFAFTQQTLGALQHYPEVRIAAVVLSSGKYFAKYQASGNHEVEVDLRQYLVRGDVMTTDRHAVVQPITLHDEKPAHLVLVASLDSYNRAMLLATAVTLMLDGLILSVAFSFFRRMSRAVTQPIDELTAVMRTVELEGHHNQRAQVVSDDEIGELAKGFNAMLSSLERQKGLLEDEIVERRAVEARLDLLAFYDPLTNLPNRRLLLDRLKQALASSGRTKRYGALLFIDLDNFKTLNDTLGHDTGDVLLQQVAQRLITCVREGDTVARLGGDEFVVMLEDLSENIEESAAQSKTVGEKVLSALNLPYQLATYVIHSTPSIGVTLFADQHEHIDELLKRADLAMYQAKAAGRNTLRFFDPDMQAVVTTRAALESDLREAILQGQFILHYQAQVVGEGRVTGAEVLLRWQHPQRGMVSPGEFIPLAEETGLILPLGHWVLQTACRQLAIWAARPEMAHLTIAVNVSARQFHHADFVDQVRAVLENTGANSQRLKLELTESLLVDDVEGVIAKMTALKLHGVGFSLDDFGTGYSSLSYLKRLPLDQLKIDQGFVRDILTDANDSAIAKMVVVLAESLGLSVIAEGVEIEAQRDFLACHGCHAYQGYLFSRPVPLQGFEEFVSRG